MEPFLIYSALKVGLSGAKAADASLLVALLPVMVLAFSVFFISGRVSLRRLLGRLRGHRGAACCSPPRMAAKELQAPVELVAEVAAAGRLPVVLVTAGGIATPADAAMMMQLGADGCSWVRGSSSQLTRPRGPPRS